MLAKIYFFFILVSASFAYNILVVYVVPGKSHSILGEGYVRLLLEDGHKVTYITPYPIKNPHPNLTQIDCYNEVAVGMLSILNIGKVLNKEVILDGSVFTDTMSTVFSAGLGHPNVQEFMRKKDVHFDLVIAEWLFCELSAGMAAVFNCPYIWAAPMEPGWMTMQLVDERQNPAYTGDFVVQKQPPYTFYERATGLLSRILGVYFKNVINFEVNAAHYERIYGPAINAQGRKLPPLEEVIYNGSLILGNSHESMGQAVSLPQNYRLVGGYHIDPDVKPLPKDLQKIMDESKDGVIYVSMGSNLRSTDLPVHIKRDLFKVFGALKQTVIWKFEDDISDLPKNIHLMPWAPQTSILAHPNARLFVTHGGLLSTTETICFGVPTIGLPVFADQFINAARAVSKGYSKYISWSQDVGKELKEAIDEIINDPKYTKRAKELSHIYHNRLRTPGDEVKFWVRHVIETNGARHLASVALIVPWYQKMYLDLAALIAVVLIVLYKSVKLFVSSYVTNKDIKKKNH